MAKVRGALFSIGASGSVAGVLTINQSSIQQVARKMPTARSAATQAQEVMRAEMSLAAAAWRALPYNEKTQWAALIAGQAHTAFSRYYKEWSTQRSTPTQPPYLPMK